MKSTHIKHTGNIELKSVDGNIVQTLSADQMYRMGVRKGSQSCHKSIPIGFINKREAMDKYQLTNGDYHKMRKDSSVLRLELGKKSLYFFEAQLDKYYAAHLVLKAIDALD